MFSFRHRQSEKGSARTPVSDKRASRKPSFGLCSAARSARSIGYTGLSIRTMGILRMRAINHRFWNSLRSLR